MTVKEALDFKKRTSISLLVSRLIPFSAKDSNNDNA